MIALAGVPLPEELAAHAGAGWVFGIAPGAVYFTAERRTADGAHVRFIVAPTAAELAGRLTAAEAEPWPPAP